VNRRAFLAALVALGCKPELPDSEWACEDEALDLAALLPADATFLGERYLTGFPGEWDRQRLVDSLSRVDDFHATVRRDFVDGRVVSIDGWRVSVTECRLAALVYLSGLC